jgi:hypothetical protein
MDSNTTFTGIISSVSLVAARVSISVFNAAVVVEWDPTMGGSGGAMIQDCRRWGSSFVGEIGVVGIVGHEA